MMNLEAQISQAIASWQQIKEQNLTQQSLAAQESAAQQLGWRVAQLALQALVTVHGKGYAGTHLACACGGWLRYQRDALRRVRTLCGDIAYERACYYCRRCGASRCPLDEQLEQSSRQVSAGVERALCVVSSHLSFATTAQVMRELGTMDLSGRQVENISEAVGAEAKKKEQAQMAAVAEQPLPLLPVIEGRTPKPRTWVVEMDGVQAGLQDGAWQEVKCGIIYQLTERVEISVGRWELLRRERSRGA